MKVKGITIKDNVSGKVVCGKSQELRRPDHFAAQLTCRAHVFEDKTKYNRARQREFDRRHQEW